MSTILKDTFTDTGGTNLTAHAIAPTNTTSTSWAVTGGFQIASGGSGCVYTFNQFNFAICDAGVANVDAFVSATTAGAAEVDLIGVIVRATDTSNFWAFWIREDGTCDLLSCISGSFTLVASASFTPGSSYHKVEVNANGSTLTCSVDGTVMLTYSSATFNQTATKCGLIGLDNSGGAPEFASFEVDSLTAAVYWDWWTNSSLSSFSDLGMGE